MPETVSTRRVFIAVNLPESIRFGIEQLQRRMKRAPGGAAVRWIPPRQIHLTMRFLGDVPAVELADLETAVQRAGLAVPAFALSPSTLGCFPSARQPRIVWLGVTGALEPLHLLWRSIAQETQSWGSREDRPFHPHLTLGRVKPEHARSARALTEGLDRLSGPQSDSWLITHVDLMESQLLSTGAEYLKLASCPLGGSQIDHPGVFPP